MNTRELVEQYLAARRAHGTALKSAERMLMQSARETGNRALTDVTPEAVATVLRGRHGLTSTRSTRYGTLSGLYRYAVARGHHCRMAKFPSAPEQANATGFGGLDNCC